MGKGIHLHQGTHAPSLSHFPYQALVYKIHKLRRPPIRRERRWCIHANPLHYCSCSTKVIVIGVLSFSQFNQRNAQRPHITLHHGLSIEHLRSHVQWGSTNVAALRVGMIQLLRQSEITQLNHTTLRNEHVTRLNVLHPYQTASIAHSVDDFHTMEIVQSL